MTKICQKCNKEFSRPKNIAQKNWDKRRFCSAKCGNIGTLKNPEPRCKTCKVLLTTENSYYPKTMNLLCKLHKANTYDTRSANQRTYRKNILKFKTRSATRLAISNGLIPKLNYCEWKVDETPCNGRIHAHHTDYNKPLEILWLCSTHHGRWHSLYKATEPVSAGTE